MNDIGYEHGFLDAFPSEAVLSTYTQLIAPLFESFDRLLPSGPDWLGMGMQQWPFDLIWYQELLYRERPRTLIECGTGGGGTTSYFAWLLSQARGDDYRVITVEINEIGEKWFWQGKNIISIHGDSLVVVPAVASLILDGPVSVTLDSAHDQQHVLKEMMAYGKFVTLGQYLIVQDTWLGLYNGTWMDGPLGAIKRFFEVNNDFVIDLHPQRWLMTQSPFGWLRRK